MFTRVLGIGMFIGVVWCSQALGQANGATDAVWLASAGKSGVNTSITGADGDLWFALEWVDPVGAPTNPGLDVFYYILSPPSVAAKTLQAPGSLTGDGMYPSILTWPGAANLIVTANEDVLQSESHLRVYKQDRDSFGVAATPETVTAAGSGFNHSKPHLTRDDHGPEQHLCWTRKNATAEDMWSKAKDQSTWMASNNRSVSITADIEDHCLIGFNYSGARYLTYHRNQTVGDDIWLEITTFSGGAWTKVANFALMGSAGADFPTVWVRSPTTTTSDIYVVAKSATDELLYWHCGPGNLTTCDSAADFGGSTVALSGGDHFDPKVFAVLRSPQVDVFSLFQKKSGTAAVRIASNCGGAGVWVDEGALPLPAGYPWGTATHLGVQLSSANPSVYWDGTEFHVAFLAESSTTPGVFDLVRYHAAPSDLCPYPIQHGFP